MKGTTTMSHACVHPSCVDLDARFRDRRLLLLGLGERHAQRREQPRARHLDEVDLRLARRRLQVRAGLAAELEDLQLVVDEDARRARSAPAAGDRGAWPRSIARRGGDGAGDRGPGRCRLRRPRCAGAKRSVLATAVRAKILCALSTGEKSWPNPEMLSVRPSSRKPGWFRQ